MLELLLILRSMEQVLVSNESAREYTHCASGGCLNTWLNHSRRRGIPSPTPRLPKRHNPQCHWLAHRNYPLPMRRSECSMNSVIGSRCIMKQSPERL